MKRWPFWVALLILIGMGFPLYAVSAVREDTPKRVDQVLLEIEKAQGVKDVRSIDCVKTTDAQLEDLGEAVMGVMHPDPSEHAFMDRMMGGEGSPSLGAMYRMMGASYLGCYPGNASFGMMTPYWGRRSRGSLDGNGFMPFGGGWHRPMMYGHGYGPSGMMGPYGGIVMWLILLVVMALLVYAVVRFAKPAGGTAETPLDILKKRYARGEIEKAEFEQKKQDLGL